jgi:hypothetical protein
MTHIWFPTDMVIQVASFIQSPIDLCRIRLVCSPWCEISKGTPFWSGCCLEFTSIQQTPHIARIIHNLLAKLTTDSAMNSVYAFLLKQHMTNWIFWQNAGYPLLTQHIILDTCQGPNAIAFLDKLYNADFPFESIRFQSGKWKQFFSHRIKFNLFNFCVWLDLQNVLDWLCENGLHETLVDDHIGVCALYWAFRLNKFEVLELISDVYCRSRVYFPKKHQGIGAIGYFEHVELRKWFKSVTFPKWIEFQGYEWSSNFLMDPEVIEFDEKCAVIEKMTEPISRGENEFHFPIRDFYFVNDMNVQEIADFHCVTEECDSDNDLEESVIDLNAENICNFDEDALEKTIQHFEQVYCLEETDPIVYIKNRKRTLEDQDELPLKRRKDFVFSKPEFNRLIKEVLQNLRQNQQQDQLEITPMALAILQNAAEKELLEVIGMLSVGIDRRGEFVAEVLHLHPYADDTDDSDYEPGTSDESSSDDSDLEEYIVEDELIYEPRSQDQNFWITVEKAEKLNLQPIFEPIERCDPIPSRDDLLDKLDDDDFTENKLEKFDEEGFVKSLYHIPSFEKGDEKGDE